MKNYSTLKEFILTGFTSSHEYEIIIFWTFFFTYALAVVGNFLIIIVTSACSKLHTPMYFLLFNLSLINVSSISVTVPKLLQITLSQRKTIIFPSCITQVFFFALTVTTELLLLAFMAFDRYAAICHPLQYTMIMRKEVCFGTMAALWLVGLANASVQTGLVLQLSFCDSNTINHFFCYLPPMFKISCSDTSLNEIMVFVACIVIVIGSCALTFASYWFILRTILSIRSAEGKKKAFSTCSSHLLVVSFYYSTIIYTYLRPSSAYSLEEDKVIAVIYSVVTPVLNPLIYTLRNSVFKNAVREIIVRISSKSIFNQ